MQGDLAAHRNVWITRRVQGSRGCLLGPISGRALRGKGSAALSEARLLTMGWIDSHCHLQDEYRPDGRSILEAAAEASAAGVEGLVCVGTGPQSSREALDVARLLRSVPGPGQDGFE